ncbi:MAG: 50S ribosomal protein L6 [Candidatus Aenigmarchaeota archaeon]|nr:50S ribosomal protein L6 [Candidatus Aenigmarchaeota archaeon]
MVVEMYSKELSIPQGVEVEILGNKVRVKGAKGDLEKRLIYEKDINIEKIDGKVKVSSESDRRHVKAVVGSTIAHIKNMINGIVKGYTYKLKVVYSHFPVTVKVEGKKIIIQNFLGERKPRVAKTAGKAEVKIDGADVTVTGVDIDDVSRTAANIEQCTRITARDRRVFQDGIWIVSKGE